MSLNVKVGFIDINEKDVEKFEKIFHATHARDRRYEVTINEAEIDILIASSDHMEKRESFIALHPGIPVISAGKGDQPNWSVEHIKGLLLATRVIRVLDDIQLHDKEKVDELPLTDNAVIVAESAEETTEVTDKIEADIVHSSADAQANVEVDFHVLVVDDSDMMQKQLVIELNKVALVLSIESAFSGEEALEKIAVQKPDLIFLDVMMPGIDGYETCTRIRKIDGMKRTPVLMLSGKASPLDEVKGVMAGCTNYITKPIVPSEFQNKLDRVLSWMQNQKK